MSGTSLGKKRQPAYSKKDLFIVSLSVVLLFACLVPSFLKQVPEPEPAKSLNTGWELVGDAGGLPVQEPVLLSGEAWKGKSLVHMVPALHATMVGSSTIAFFTSSSDLSFQLDGEPYEDYRFLPSGFDGDYGAGWFLILLPDDASDKLLSIRPGERATATENLEIGAFFYGPYAECVRSVAFYRQFNNALDLLTAVAGVFLLGLGFYAFKTGGNYPLPVNVGIFALLVACSQLFGVSNLANINTGGPQAGALPLLLIPPSYILILLSEEELLSNREERMFQGIFATSWVFSGFALLASVTVTYDKFSIYFYIVQYFAVLVLSIGSAIRAIVVRRELFDIGQLVGRSCLLVGFLLDTATYFRGDALRMGQAARYSTILYLAISGFFLYRKAVIHVRKERAEKAQLTVAHMRLMSGQIQPHFIFNTLGAIQSFMRRDPEKAAELMQNFTGYLRYAMRHAEYDELIPFETELQHIRTYMNIEKARFGDELTVVYDLRTLDFSVPPLTIQPLVENAVKHGIRGRAGGGTVTLRTREVRDNILIEIIDDGVGFNMEEVKRRPRADRLGLHNVQYRLANELDARMQIDSMPGRGTRVFVTFLRSADETEPDREKQVEDEPGEEGGYP